jgi:hypothetical protein
MPYIERACKETRINVIFLENEIEKILIQNEKVNNVCVVKSFE